MKLCGYAYANREIKKMVDILRSGGFSDPEIVLALNNKAVLEKTITKILTLKDAELPLITSCVMGSSRIPSQFIGRKPTSYDFLSYLIKNSRGYIKNVSEHSHLVNGGIHKVSLYRAINELSQKGIVVKINLGGEILVGFNPELKKEMKKGMIIG